MRKSRTNANAMLSRRHLTTLFGAILLPMALTSCGKKAQNSETQTAQKSEDDFLDKHAKPEERKYLVAAKPFFIAVANRKYADAYALLQPCEGSHVAQSICACSARCRFSAE